MPQQQKNLKQQIQFLMMHKEDEHDAKIFKWLDRSKELSLEEMSKSIRDGSIDLQKFLIHQGILNQNLDILKKLFEQTKEYFELVYIFDDDFQVSIIFENFNNFFLKGESPLHWAAKIGFIPGIRYLLDHVKVDLNQLSEMNHLRVIDISALNDQVEVLKLLVEEYHVDPFKENDSGKNALDYAISEHAMEYLKSLHGYKKRSLDDNSLHENESNLKKSKEN